MINDILKQDLRLDEDNKKEFLEWVIKTCRESACLESLVEEIAMHEESGERGSISLEQFKEYEDDLFGFQGGNLNSQICLRGRKYNDNHL